MRHRWALGTGAFVIAGLVAGLVGSAEPAGTRIGYLDLQKVLVRSVAGVGAREQLERERASMLKEFEGRKAEIDKLREELDKKGLVLSADSKREKEEIFQRKVRDARRLQEDMEKELQRKEQVMVGRISQEVVGLVERMGKERGFLMILERRGAAVVYGDPEADITDEVIKLYDQEKAKKP
jgi:outer membrane protein